MAEYLYKKLRGDPAKTNMNLQNFEYHEPNVARKSKDQKQMMHTEAIFRSDSNTVFFRWYEVEADSWYSSAAITFENSDDWMADWSRSTHLISSRIESLREAAETGRTNKLSHSMAYRLFANLVDWSEVYKGMTSVFLDGMEAYAEIELSTKGTGEWSIPPWHMESLVVLSGFILNGSDAMDNKNNFFITPGYKSMRFAKPVKPGGRYQSYVKMMPTETPNLYAGDVYVLEAGTIVAVMEKAMYRSWPRIMLQRFFVPPDKKGVVSKSKSGAHNAHKAPAPAPAPITNGTVAHSVKSAPNGHQQHGASTKTMTNGTLKPPAINGTNPTTNNHHHEKVNGARETTESSEPLPPSKKIPNGTATTANTDPTPIATNTKKNNDLVDSALAIIADTAACETEDLDEEALFTDLGIDSLMSLVLAQKFRSEIGVEVRDSIFVEFSCIGDLCRWLEKM